MDDDNLIYRPGQCVMCRVEGIEPGGYSASIVGTVPPGEKPPEAGHSLMAFLPSTEPLRIGQVVPATFVCMHDNRALMTFAFMLGTTERIQTSTAPDAENAFAIWVDSYPANQRRRRAIDLFMPALSGKLLHELKCAQCDTDTLLCELEMASFTGCIKARSEEKKSRSAMLIHKGRVAGAIYGKKDAQETFPVEKAIALIQTDIKEPETFLQVYELPSDAVLSLASLFLGCPIARDPHASVSDYIDTSLMSMSLSGETGCITYSLDGNQTDSILMVHGGVQIGGYQIIDQSFIDSKEMLNKLSAMESGSVEAHIIPMQLLSSAVTLGYKLTN